jgi:hypothetical protein
VRALVDQALTVDQTALDQLHTLYTSRLRALSRKRTYLIDLAAEQQWSREDLLTRIEAIAHERTDLHGALAHLQQQRDRDHNLYNSALKLLENPTAVYAHSEPHTRALLNRALLGRLYIDAAKITHEVSGVWRSMRRGSSAVYTIQAQGLTGSMPRTRS